MSIRVEIPGPRPAPDGRVVGLDPAALIPMSRAKLLSTIQAAAAVIARLEGLTMHAVALFDERGEKSRGVPKELALGLAITYPMGERMVKVAEALTTRLPSVLALMDRGILDFYKASKVCEATSWLSDAKAREADAILALRLAGKNPTGIRRCANNVAAKIDPEGLERRVAAKKADRRVRLTHHGEGSASLSLEGPADKAAAAYSRIDRAARALRRRGEPRTLEQLRADVMLDLCLSGAGGPAVRAEVFVYVDFLTLLGVNEDPAFLAGHGPVPVALVRNIMAGPNTVMRRLITDPLTGQVLELGRTRYRPKAALDEFVRVRDRECRSPGCTRPAQKCQIDHVQDWAKHGVTDAVNLDGFCELDHKIKDEPGWHYEQDDDGTLVVTTPTGAKYTSVPEPLHEPRYTEEEPPF